MSDDREIDDLLALPTTVTIAGREVELLPPKLGKLAQLLALARPFSDVIDQGISTKGEVNITDLLTRAPESALEMIALYAGVERAWVDDLDLDDASELLARIVAVNIDFFVSRVAPSLSQVATLLTAGQSSSKGNPRAQQAKQEHPSRDGRSPLHS